MIMATTGTGGGVRLQPDGLQSYRCLLVVALLVVTSTMFVIDDVHCFPQFEEDALDDIIKKWIKLNPHLVTLFNSSTDRRPCDNLPNAQFWASDPVIEGALTRDVYTLELQLQLSNATGNYYEASVTSLALHGSNSSCTACTATYDDHQCGFDVIIGKLPLGISNLTKLQTLVHFKLKSLFTWMWKGLPFGGQQRFDGKH